MTNKTFCLTSDVGDSIQSLVVEGLPVTPRPMVTTSTPQSVHMGRTTMASQVGSSYPSTDRMLVPVRRCVSPATTTVKVVLADVSKAHHSKFEFHKVGQMFITVNDATANVDYVTNAIQRKWGGGHILVTSDGLPIEDSSGTQGIV